MVTILVIAGGTAVYCLRKTSSNEGPSVQMGIPGVLPGTGTVSASGITGIGTTEETLAVENQEIKLLIEEICVSLGEEVSEGDPILRLSMDSVAEAKELLETAARQAELDYRAGLIAYEQSLITAESERDLAVLTGDQAIQVYDETVAGLKDNVEKAEEALAEAKEKIEEYQAAAESNTYYEYYKVGEYKDIYDENLKLLTTRMEEWGYGWSQVLSGQSSGSSVAGGNDMAAGNGAAGGSSAAGGNGVAGGNDMATGNGTSGGSSLVTGIALTTENNQDLTAVNISTVSGGDASGNSQSGNEDKGYLTVLKGLYSVLEQNLKDYEQAQSDYEDAVANAGFELQTLQLSLSSLENTLTEAKEKYETQLLEAKLKYETSLADAERAQSDYETAVEKAGADLEKLKGALEDAETDVANFNKSIGDGYYYAGSNGTILRVMARAEQYLTAGGSVFLYSNTEDMTVTVSVDQSDIAKIAIGDTAWVEAGDYGSLQGVVTGINPVSASDSRTSVVYSVTVSLSGNTGELAANQNVTVIFGLGGSDDE